MCIILWQARVRVKEKQKASYIYSWILEHDKELQKGKSFGEEFISWMRAIDISANFCPEKTCEIPWPSFYI